jgi:hypothetical protein
MDAVRMRSRLFLSLLASLGVAYAVVSAGPSHAFVSPHSSLLETRTLVIQGGRGEFHIIGTGRLEGRIGTGRLIAKASSSLKVFRFQRVRDLPGSRKEFTGTNLGVDARGSFDIRIDALGVALTSTGRGTVTLSSQGFARPGRFSTDGRPFQAVPRLARTFAFGH